MRRTIEYGVWMGDKWEKRVTARVVKSPALAEGLHAYAKEHIKREQRTCMRLTRQWSGLRQKATAYLAGNTNVGLEVVVYVGEEDVDKDDKEGDVDGKEVVDSIDEGDEDNVDDL